MRPKFTPIIYIKLPEYIIPLMFKRYGNPIRLDIGSRMYKLCVKSLISIEDMERNYSKISCSMHAYNIAKAKKSGGLSEDQFVGTPTGKDIDNFVPIVMPDTILVKDEELGIDRAMPVTNYHTLTLSAAQKLRQMIRQLFWTDLNQFNKVYADKALSSRMPNTHKNRTLKFLHTQGISDDLLETVCRTETRLASEMK